METKQQCSQRVFDGTRGDRGHICTRYAKVFLEDGTPFCNLHSPEGQAEKERKFQETYAAQRDADHKKYEMLAYDRKAGDYCRALGLTYHDLSPANPEG